MSDPLTPLAAPPSAMHLQVQRGSAGLSGAAWGRPVLNTAQSKEEQLRQVCDEFEAIFLNQFLQEARKSELADGLLSSSEGDQFQAMMDSELARSASTSLSLGISDALFAQFSAQLGTKDS